MRKANPSLCRAKSPHSLAGLGYEGIVETVSPPETRRAALICPSNHRLAVGYVPPNHGTSGLEPLEECWAQEVFTRKSWSCLRHPRKAQTGHQCLRVNLEEPFCHLTDKPGVILGHRLGPTSDFLLPAICVKVDADSPWRATNHPGLKTTMVLPCGSHCQQLPLHFIQTPFPIRGQSPSGQKDAAAPRRGFCTKSYAQSSMWIPTSWASHTIPWLVVPWRTCPLPQPSFELTRETQRADCLEHCAPKWYHEGDWCGQQLQRGWLTLSQGTWCQAEITETSSLGTICSSPPFRESVCDEKHLQIFTFLKPPC